MIKQGPRGNTIPTLDIGKIVRKRMFDTGMNRSRLARKMGRNANGLSDRLYSSSMQAYLIWELSVALNHNFFADLPPSLMAQPPPPPTRTPAPPPNCNSYTRKHQHTRYAGTHVAADTMGIIAGNTHRAHSLCAPSAAHPCQRKIGLWRMV